MSGVILCAGLQAAEAGDVSDALRSLAASDVVTRKVPLTELGIDTPLALTSSFIARDIYIPVPAGVPLIKPSLSFDGRYLRGDGGTTTYVVSLDGYAVAARSPEKESGVTGFDIGVDGSPRDNGFVKLGIEWLPSIGKFYCDNTRPIGNQLLLSRIPTWNTATKPQI
nr:hypothetical protein [Marinicella sp. W31]MDC2879255.1 hypothetical protein [Marinicella sp. W31]